MKKPPSVTINNPSLTRRRKAIALINIVITFRLLSRLRLSGQLIHMYFNTQQIEPIKAPDTKSIKIEKLYAGGAVITAASSRNADKREQYMPLIFLSFSAIRNITTIKYYFKE